MRVVTSTYLGATSGKALDALVGVGVEVKVKYDAFATKLHAKSWLFYRPGELGTAYSSTNLSQAALHDGLEWNVHLARSDAAPVFTRMRSTFDSYGRTSRTRPTASKTVIVWTWLSPKLVAEKVSSTAAERKRKSTVSRQTLPSHTNATRWSLGTTSSTCSISSTFGAGSSMSTGSWL